MKYKVYATQKMRFNTIAIEADSEEEAVEKYEKMWNDGVSVYSLDYDEDSTEYVVNDVLWVWYCDRCQCLLSQNIKKQKHEEFVHTFHAS